LREALDVFAGQHIDITLKDADTCENQPHRLRDWVRITREVIEEKAGAFV
jgi:hypothetical protein